MQEMEPTSQTMTKEAGKSPPIPLNERAAYTPAEFAALFGKEPTWAYRLAYKRKVKVIRELGRMMIPRAELERVTGSAAEYVPNETSRARRKAAEALR